MRPKHADTPTVVPRVCSHPHPSEGAFEGAFEGASEGASMGFLVGDGVGNGVGGNSVGDDVAVGCFVDVDVVDVVDVSGVGDAVLVGAPVIVGSKDGATVGVMGMLINPNQLTRTASFANILENSASSDSAGSSPVGSCNPTLIRFTFRRPLRRSVFPVVCAASTARAVQRTITPRDSFMVEQMQ